MMARTPALIETIRIRNGAAPFADLHRRRLARSCRELGIPYPAEPLFPEDGPDRVIRLEVSAEEVHRTERAVEPLTAARLVTSRVAHVPYPHKTTDRAQFDRALAEARALAADDGVMLTATGFLAECAIWTLFWWEGKTLCTPALGLGVLPGVARSRIAELVPLAEREAPRRELDGVSVFVANAVRGIVPVSLLDGRAVAPSGGTTRLQGVFWDRSVIISLDPPPPGA